VHEARRLKSSHTNIELLKEKLLEEQNRRERAEMELSKLQEIEAKEHKLELELASYTALLSNIPYVSSIGDIPQMIADLQRCAYFTTFISFYTYSLHSQIVTVRTINLIHFELKILS
jgi:mitotic spindle assembly checkpoint protein MAD1